MSKKVSKELIDSVNLNRIAVALEKLVMVLALNYKIDNEFVAKSITEHNEIILKTFED